MPAREAPCRGGRRRAASKAWRGWLGQDENSLGSTSNEALKPTGPSQVDDAKARGLRDSVSLAGGIEFVEKRTDMTLYSVNGDIEARRWSCSKRPPRSGSELRPLAASAPRPPRAAQPRAARPGSASAFSPVAPSAVQERRRAEAASHRQTRIVDLDRDDDRLRRTFPRQLSGLSAIVSANSIGSPPRRSESLAL